jgi:hypothetical protein
VPEREGAPGAALELVEELVGRWTWRYVDARDDLVLAGNDIFSTMEEARESATTAYPDVSSVKVRQRGQVDGAGTLAAEVEVRREAIRLLLVLGVVTVAGLALRRLRQR